MNDYMEVRIDCSPCSEDITDLLADLLAGEGYESFLPDADGLTAYIPVALYSPDNLACLDTIPIPCSRKINATLIEGRDWNSEWEKNYFKPIVVGDRCVIHSSFHTDIPKCDYDIVIDPKMAFGTGHHSTTCSIITALLDMDLTRKSLIDMGTGTGILAILAAMRGASPVTGIEIDEAAFANTLENRKLNGNLPITFIRGDASAMAGIPYKADVFLANINRNVITADLHLYVRAMAPGGIIILSGFYTCDIPVILEVAAPLGLSVVSQSQLNDWACLCLRLDR